MPNNLYTLKRLILLLSLVQAILCIPGTIVWSYLTQGWIVTTPTEANGVLYVSSTDGNIYALEASTGQKLFNYPIGYDVETTPVYIPSTNTLIVACTNSLVYAINTNTVTLLWTVNITLIQNSLLPLQIVSNPVLSVDTSLVYVTTASIPGSGQPTNNYIVALSTASGTRTWYNNTSTAVYSSPTLSADGSKLFVADSSTLVYSLNNITGYNDWARPITYPVTGPLTVDSDQVFVVDNQGNVQALFTFSGVSQWSQSLYPSTTVCYPTLWNPTNNLYIACKNGNVFALSGANNGAFVWSQYWTNPNNAFQYSAPTVALTPGTSSNVTIYVTSTDTCVYALNDSLNGTLSWSTCTEGELRSSPLIDTTLHLLYVGGLDGRLYAISTV